MTTPVPTWFPLGHYPSYLELLHLVIMTLWNLELIMDGVIGKPLQIWRNGRRWMKCNHFEKHSCVPSDWVVPYDSSLLDCQLVQDFPRLIRLIDLFNLSSLYPIVSSQDTALETINLMDQSNDLDLQSAQTIPLGHFLIASMGKLLHSTGFERASHIRLSATLDGWLCRWVQTKSSLPRHPLHGSMILNIRFETHFRY